MLLEVLYEVTDVQWGDMSPAVELVINPDQLKRNLGDLLPAMRLND
jgi:hypothetical protein